MILGGQLPGKVGSRWGKKIHRTEMYGVIFLPQQQRCFVESYGDTPRTSAKSRSEWSGVTYGKTVAETSALYGAKVMRNS